MSTVFHSVRFFRKPEEPGMIRAVCTCDWHIEGEPEHVHKRAATHDKEDVKQPKPAARRAPFVSGLSRLQPGDVL